MVAREHGALVLLDGGLRQHRVELLRRTAGGLDADHGGLVAGLAHVTKISEEDGVF